MVATWIQSGWAPVAPDYFIGPDGGRWEVQEGPLTPFAEAFKSHAIRRQWGVAPKHSDGAGLEGMPPFYSLRKKFVALGRIPSPEALLACLSTLLLQPSGLG